jgi:tetratricopeptide (TPR) repeat protein
LKTSLSQSPIWEVQRAYYEQKGVDAWREGEVPHYVTSNPTVARAYAAIIAAYMRDVNPTTPVTIVELGSGHGRFAYHLVKSLDHFHPDLPSYRYIMTDFAQQNIDEWRDHSRLQDFFNNGIVDIALFDASKSDHLDLQVSGKRVKAGDLKGPIIVIANYLFDSIPHDLFKLEGGTLYEGLVTIAGMPSSSNGQSPAEIIEKIELDYVYQPVKLPHYNQPALDGVLEHYAENIDDTHILFPNTGIDCLERLRKLSTAGMMVLSADKGYHRIEDIEDRTPPGLVSHGSFSYSVNYHAFARYIVNTGGNALTTSYHHHSINVVALLTGGYDYTQTKLAYNAYVERFGPDTFFVIKTHLERVLDQMELHEIIAYLRLSGYDARLFKLAMPRLSEITRSASSSLQEQFYQVLLNVWDMYYPLNEDLAFDIGLLLYELDYYREALEFLEQSRKEFGPETPTLYNMGLCYYQLKDWEAARDLLEEVINRKSNHRDAKAILKRINGNLT